MRGLRFFGRCLLRSVTRAVRRCSTQAQAVSFNMFLAFFPMLLLALGILGISARLTAGVEDMTIGLRSLLPPGSRQVVSDFLERNAALSWQLTLIGLAGTLFAGTQVMRQMIDGFRMLHGDVEPHTFWMREARALVLLCATIVPWLAAVVVTVFGKQLRAWVLGRFWLPPLARGFWTVLLYSAAVVVAMLILAVIYRVGRPARQDWQRILPGAALATLLWCGVNAAFGLYVQAVRYDLVYGGLAAAIGLLLWMQLTTMIVFFGAAFNAEFSARRRTSS